MDFVLDLTTSSADFNCVNRSTIHVQVLREVYKLMGFWIKIFKK